jgi:hypothetical protein
MTDESRRFVFHGAASVLSGRVYRPRAVAGVVASPAASALTVAGGLSQAQVTKRTRIAPWLTIGGASTMAEGGFDNLKQAVEMTWHRVSEDALATSTRVSATIKDFALSLDGHAIVASLLRATLLGSHPTDALGTPIRLGRDTDVKGLTIDGFPVTVVFDRERFEAADTFDKLVSGERSGTARKGASGQVCLSTIVRELKWTKKPHPTATITGNVIDVPDFGQLFFGELLATAEARRLTLVRLRLGSPTALSIGINDVHTDGSWYPP